MGPLFEDVVKTAVAMTSSTLGVWYKSLSLKVE